MVRRRQVLVREGKVVHARLDEADEPVDAECVYYLLTWGAGEFEFVACVVEGVDRVNVSTTHLLMEGARLMDEANEPSLQAPPSRSRRVSRKSSRPCRRRLIRRKLPRNPQARPRRRPK